MPGAGVPGRFLRASVLQLLPGSSLQLAAGNGIMEEPADTTDDLFHHCAGKMTLEAILDSTGEFDHLNELVILQIEKSGGYQGPENYFRTVTPILDLLEVEIRIRYTPGTTRNQMKLVIQDWIDKEIAALR